jgi:hypothetical protein
MWGWLWAAVASGSDPDALSDEVLAELVAELTPIVAEAAGRPLPGPVAVAMSTHDAVSAQLAQGPPALGEPAPVDLEPPEPPRRVTEGALGVHLPHAGIFLLRDGLDDLIARRGLAREEVLPVVRCVLAHEIVHALQHAYSDSTGDDTPEQRLGRAALLEGHATLVGLRVCAALEGDAIARRVETAQGLDAAPTAPVDSPSLRYGYGRALAERLEAEDPERLWSALVAPAPSWADVLSVVRPALGGGWEDPQPVSDALAVLGRAEAVPSADGFAALARLVAPPGIVGPRVHGGWMYRSDDERETLAVFRLDPGEAAELVHRRRVEVRGHSIAAVGVIPGSIRKLRAVPRIPDARVENGLRVSVFTTSGARYVEHWYASDLAVVIHAARSPKVGVGAIEAELVALLAALPATSPALPADLGPLEGWLDRVRGAAPPLVPGVDWRMLRARAAAQAGAERPCAVFDDVLARDAALVPQPLWRAAYRCALLTGEFTVADRLGPGMTLVDARLTADHASRLLAMGRPEDALAALDRAGPGPLDVVAALVDLRLAALAQAARFDALTDLALKGGSPAARVAAAEALAQAERGEDAQRILAVVCPLEPEVCAGR